MRLTRPISIAMTGEMVGRLDMVSDHLGISRSALVTYLLDDQLEELERELGDPEAFGWSKADSEEVEP